MSIHMSDELDALPLNRKNPGPFVICAVLVDVSSSMNINNGEPIRELNKGYSEFREFICNDDMASQRTQATCKFCDSVITSATNMHTSGGWADPWGQQITFTSITADVSTPNRYVVEFHLVSDQHVSHRMGEPPKTYETSQGPILIQVLWKDGTGWTIEGVNPL